MKWNGWKRSCEIAREQNLTPKQAHTQILIMIKNGLARKQQVYGSRPVFRCVEVV